MLALGTISVVAVGAGAERILDTAACRLRDVGFETPTIDFQSGQVPLVVLFDAADAGLLDLVGQLGGDRGRCMIAVACDREALRNGRAWQIVSAGASDVLSFDESSQWAACVAARVQRWRRVKELARSAEVSENLIGESRPWQAAVWAAIEAACFTDAPVVLTGETGTGKERVARLIHALDPRPHKAELILLDCTTIVPTLSGSEFFGHERGAFTGAAVAREGACALANRGTLFLDEVGELPLPLQSELLRVVQEGAYKRVGGNEWRTTSFRLICATNRDLFAEAAAGRFRHDLLYRLAGLMLHLPNLAQRRDDIVPLARHFLGEMCGGGAPRFEHEVETLLVGRDYPGNVRELRQLMTRLAYRHAGPGPITVGDVPEDEREPGSTATKTPADDFEDSVRHAVDRGLTLRQIERLGGDVRARGRQQVGRVRRHGEADARRDWRGRRDCRRRRGELMQDRCDHAVPDPDPLRNQAPLGRCDPPPVQFGMAGVEHRVGEVVGVAFAARKRRGRGRRDAECHNATERALQQASEDVAVGRSGRRARGLGRRGMERRCRGHAPFPARHVPAAAPGLIPRHPRI